MSRSSQGKLAYIMSSVAGIDWATEPKKRAIVQLCESAGKVAVTHVHSSGTDRDVVKVCTNVSLDVVAIDIPFGWPSAFCRFVHEWSATGDNNPTLPEPETFRFRATDRVIRKELGKTPLSVSSDRIAMGARAWAAIAANHLLRPQIRVEVETKPTELPMIVEVYPAATLAALFPKNGAFKRYKSDAAIRASLLDQLKLQFRLRYDNQQRSEIVSGGSDSDKIDALIAAITALIHIGRVPKWTSRSPEKIEIEAARREGWIFFPVQSNSRNHTQ